MPPSKQAGLALAGQLRAWSNTELMALVDEREIFSSGGSHVIKDFFDLADMLLEADSIQSALGRLDRGTLATLGMFASLDLLAGLEDISVADAATRLTAAGADPEPLAEQLATALENALVTRTRGADPVPPDTAAHPDDRWALLAAVAEQLDRWPSLDLPSRDELLHGAPPRTLAPVSDTDREHTDRLAAENGFTTSTAVSELVVELQREPARELSRGGISLPDSRRLSACMGVDIVRVPELLQIADRAGLIARDGSRWLATPASTDWLEGSSDMRWAHLAGAWLDRLPSDIRIILRTRSQVVWGDQLGEYVRWLFPAGGDHMSERVEIYTRDAALLGVSAQHVPSTPGMELLSHGRERAAAAMAALFPAEVHQVYVQPDLTIVSPGPLAPQLDARLRTMADVETHTLAASYRVSTGSLHRAMAGGETVGTIRDFLTGLSLTGIPQPVDYMLEEAGSRYGLIQVAVSHEGRALIRSADEPTLRTMLVDHDIASLGLRRREDGLDSRFDQQTVFWALTEARYPVTAIDAEGNVITVRRPHATAEPEAESPGATAALIERLRLGSSDDQDVTDAAWLARQLDVAIRDKVALTVTVDLGNGTTSDFQLEPASIASGRMRALDRRADIERTLPLSSIVAVGPAAPE